MARVCLLPRVAIIDDPSANAFTTGRDPRNAVVAVSTGILDRDELKGVLAYEVSHVRTRDILIASVAARQGQGGASTADWARLAQPPMSVRAGAGGTGTRPTKSPMANAASPMPGRVVARKTPTSTAQPNAPRTGF